MSVKTFTLNGELVSAGEDQTILDVCDEQKVPIPRLCHLEGLGEIGACRLCMVEIQGWNKLAPSCMTRVEEGMGVILQFRPLFMCNSCYIPFDIFGALHKLNAYFCIAQHLYHPA